MALTEKEKKIRKETRRLKERFKTLEPNKLEVVAALIDRAAYITISLQELEDILNETGWVEEYTNGRNQGGYKPSSAAGVYNSLTKNLTTIMKQLVDLVPPTQREGRLAAMMEK